MSSANFPTAPGWYKPFLEGEQYLLRKAAPLIRKRLHLASFQEIQLGGPANFQTNIVGSASAERCVPGVTPVSGLLDHIQRYIWALPRVEGKHVVELGCGSGYGTQLLSLTAKEADGVDINSDSIAAASRKYLGPRFTTADITNTESLPSGDVAVCFEVLEHVSDPSRVLEAAIHNYPRLLLSVPNPLFAGSHMNPHHLLDWPLSVLKQKLRTYGGKEIRCYHQKYSDPHVRKHASFWNATWILDVRR